MNALTMFIFIGSTLWVGINLPNWLAKVIVYFQNRSIIKAITPTDLDEKRLCKAPHVWLNTRAWTEKGTVDSKVCRVCGLIDGTKKMATEAAIDQIEENNKVQAVEEQVYQDFISKENGDLRAFFASELKEGLSFEKLVQLHNAGITFGARYNKYKVTRLPEMLKILEKSDA